MCKELSDIWFEEEARRQKKQKTNKSAALFFFIYAKKVNEWTIAHSSNLLHSLTHAEKERKETHYRYIYMTCARAIDWTGITETTHAQKFAYMEAIRNNSWLI